MTRYSVLQILLLLSSMTSQVINSMTSQEVEEVKKAEKVGDLPKELRHKITSSALELRENPKYEQYKKFNAGSFITGIAFNADNTRVLVGSDDGVARVCDVEKGEVLTELKGHTDEITSVALSADGTSAVTGSYDETVRVWNALTGKLLKTLQVGSWVTSVALNADGSSALIGCRYSDSALLYTTSTGELKKLKGHRYIFNTFFISSVALSPDGTSAVTGSMDGTTLVWDTHTGKPIRTLEVDAPITLVALSADGITAVTVTNDSRVLVWNVKTGALLNTLVMDRTHIMSVALSKNGKRVLTGTDNNMIQVWNTNPLPGKNKTTTPLTLLTGHTKHVTALAFVGDDLIASGSSDNTALIWKRFALKPHKKPQEQKDFAWEAFKESFYNPESALSNER